MLRIFRPTRIQTVTILSAVVIVMIALYLINSQYFSRSASIMTKLTIAQVGDFFIYAPLYVAIDAGFFTAQGIDVSLLNTGGDEKSWAAVISGEASFGVGDPVFVAISDARGQPGVVVASIVNGVPFWGVTLEKDIPEIRSPDQLDHYWVATFPAPSTAYTLQKKMFIEGGLEPHIRQGAFGTLLPMLRANQADIALELEPNVSQSVTEGARVVYSLASIYGNFASTGLTTTPRFTSEHEASVRGVVCAVQLALHYSRTDQESVLKILLKRFPEITPDVARFALQRVLTANILPLSVEIEKSAWEKAIKLRVELGDLSVPKPMNAYVNNGFATWSQKNCSR
jgi:NitT/TauT family transport system substrate-binding protein